jgi:membrane-bound metal-dependent hydrolase YbcI (DUF457 family)
MGAMDMKVTKHIGISTIAAISAYKLIGSQSMSIALFLSGILIDLDHVFDYILLSKEGFSIGNFFSWYDEGKWQKVFLFFHSYELITILAFVTFVRANEVLIGITAGCVLHLLADQIAVMGRGFSPWFYFISYRYSVGFEKKKYISKRGDP